MRATDQRHAEDSRGIRNARHSQSEVGRPKSGRHRKDAGLRIPSGRDIQKHSNRNREKDTGNSKEQRY